MSGNILNNMNKPTIRDFIVIPISILAIIAGWIFAIVSFIAGSWGGKWTAEMMLKMLDPYKDEQ